MSHLQGICQSMMRQCRPEMCGDKHFGIHVCTFASASASAGFCHNRSWMSTIQTDKQMSVTIEQVADKFVCTPPLRLRGGGCLCLKKCLAANSLFCVTYYSCFFNSKNQNSEHCSIIMTLVGHVHVRS